VIQEVLCNLYKT